MFTARLAWRRVSSRFSSTSSIPRFPARISRVALYGVSAVAGIVAASYLSPALSLPIQLENKKNVPIVTGKETTLLINGEHVPIVTEFAGQDPGDSNRPRLVILGSGWGATSILKALQPAQYNTIVISEANYFLFTPLLPEATTGTVEARSLQESIRKICQSSRAKFWEGEAYDVLPDKKLVHVKSKDGRQFLIPYDKLVISVGAQNATFGVPGVKENTSFLKSIHDARRIRYEMMNLFERAALPVVSEDEKRRLLSFVVAGGGPTGVEYAAALHDFLHEDAAKYFPDLVQYAKVHLIQSSEHILNAFAESISEFAEKKFRRNQIDLITQARVTKVEPNKIVYKKKNVGPGEADTAELDFGLCVWSTGIEMRDFTRRIMSRIPEQKNTRALETDSRLRVKGVDDIYALGDCATIENPKLTQMVVNRFKKSGSSGLYFDEFKKICEEIVDHHPQTRVHLRALEKMFITYDVDQSNYLDLTELETLFKDVSSKLTTLPATAQVAAQQGKYLAQKFNKLSTIGDVGSVESWNLTEKSMPAFSYFHLGSFSYIGGETAVYDYGNWGQGGWLVALMWRGAYLSEQVSFRTRTLLAFDWMKKNLFGRDISRS